jgi:hypothetical protein
VWAQSPPSRASNRSVSEQVRGAACSAWCRCTAQAVPQGCSPLPTCIPGWPKIATATAAAAAAVLRSRTMPSASRRLLRQPRRQQQQKRQTRQQQQAVRRRGGWGPRRRWSSAAARAAPAATGVLSPQPSRLPPRRHRPPSRATPSSARHLPSMPAPQLGAVLLPLQRTTRCCRRCWRRPPRCPAPQPRESSPPGEPRRLHWRQACCWQLQLPPLLQRRIPGGTAQPGPPVQPRSWPLLMPACPARDRTRLPAGARAASRGSGWPPARCAQAAGPGLHQAAP